MGWEMPVLHVPGTLANADLSAKQFYCVKQHTVANKVALTSVAGEIFLGVLQDEEGDADGEACSVMACGVTRVKAAEALTAGDKWGANSDGRAMKIEGTTTGADVGKYFGGIVLEGAAENGLAVVTVGMQTGMIGN